MHLSFGVMAASLWLAAPTLAATSSSVASSSSSLLLEAEAAMRAGLHGKCIELAKDALKSGGLDERGTAHAWLVRGRCHAIAGDVDRAERSYAVAARVQPDLILPFDDALWTRVRPEGDAPNTALRLVATAVVLAGADGGDGEGAVVIEVAVHDDLALGTVVRLLDADGREIVSAPVEAPSSSGQLVVVHRFSGFAVAGVTAELLDRSGNRLRHTALVDDAIRVAPSSPAPAPTAAVDIAPVRDVGALAYLGGAMATAGLLTVSVCGINTAVVAQADQTRIFDDELPWLAGVGIGAAAVVVGMGLVVAERQQFAAPGDVPDHASVTP
jgi:hypothetical protein